MSGLRRAGRCSSSRASGRSRRTGRSWVPWQRLRVDVDALDVVRMELVEPGVSGEQQGVRRCGRRGDPQIVLLHGARDAVEVRAETGVLIHDIAHAQLNYHEASQKLLKRRLFRVSPLVPTCDAEDLAQGDHRAKWAIPANREAKGSVNPLAGGLGSNEVDKNVGIQQDEPTGRDQERSSSIRKISSSLSSPGHLPMTELSPERGPCGTRRVCSLSGWLSALGSVDHSEKS